ncbi:MAG TPA: DUF3617 domain-containing protein [Candidatus Deferrimicrobium sp.]
MKNIARHTVTLFALILLCAAGTAHSAGVDMKEGEWEIASETTMKMEGMSIPPQANKSTYCLSREDLVPKSEKDKDCKIVKQKVVGNTVSWRMECKKAEGEGEITYRGSTYKGNFRMKVKEDGQAMTMDMKMSGRYLGPCPKGQKSGPTGQTAKQMAAGQQAAAQAQQQQTKLQAEQAANAKKGEALIKRSVVPTEERGACAQEGFGRTPECEGKIGDLNLKPGEYEITVERGSRIGTTYTPVETERKTVCLTEDEPVPAALSAGRPTHVKRGKERITWTDSAGGRTTKGGIIYRGNSLEGAVTNTMDLGAGQISLSVAKVTGRRIGDGNCTGGRSYTAKGRGYSAKKKEGDSAIGENKTLKNPVKGIKNLFGF